MSPSHGFEPAVHTPPSLRLSLVQQTEPYSKGEAVPCKLSFCY